ncbi:MAG: N-acetylmuramoyl-L-alanine amidase [Hamadaea sp.]|nr:N-acetylmuramoyl-L-alanine amidase [Hamadaea sp.]
MDIISRAEAGLPPISGVSRRTEPWAGITTHHTGGSYTTWRAIHDWQTEGRPDDQELVYIGYSYGIANGLVTELRGWDYRPAGDHENSRIQVCFMGTWDSKLPPAADLGAFRDFVAYARARAKAELAVITHRMVWPSGHRYATDCPGDALHAWVRNELLEDDMQLTDKLSDTSGEYQGWSLNNAFVTMLKRTGYLANKAGLAAKLDEILVKLSADPGTPVTLTDADRAALVAGIVDGLDVPTADEVADAVADEQRARLEA